MKKGEGKPPSFSVYIILVRMSQSISARDPSGVRSLFGPDVPGYFALSPFLLPARVPSIYVYLSLSFSLSLSCLHRHLAASSFCSV